MEIHFFFFSIFGVKHLKFKSTSKPKLKKMKRTQFIKNILIAIGGTAFVSCENDFFNENNDSETLKIDEAQKWFNAKQSKLKIESKNIKTPIWRDGAELKISNNVSIVVVPLVQSHQTLIKIQDKRPDKNLKSDDFYLTGDINTNLVFRKTNSNIESFEMRIVAEENYYEKNKINKMDSKNFDGYVYFYDDIGTLKNSLVLKNGKVYGNLASNKKAKVSVQIFEVCTTWYVTTCYGNDCGGGYYNTTCNTYFVDSSSYGTNDGFSGAFSVGAGGSTISTNTVNTIEHLLQDPGIKAEWDKLNPMEKDYFRNKPWQIPGAYSAATFASVKTFEFYCNNEHDGNQNAFKHTYWSALLALTTDVQSSKLITDAHEYGAPETDLRMAMDFFNNKLGRDIYMQNRNIIGHLVESGEDYHQFIANLVLEKIGNGYGKQIMGNNLVATSNYGRCSN